MVDGIIEFAFLSQEAAQVIVRFRITWPQFDRLAIMSYCLISLAMILKSDSKVVMRHPAGGVVCECPCVKGYKVVVNRTLLPCQKAKRQQEDAAAQRTQKQSP